jgi:hypothetical protein
MTNYKAIVEALKARDSELVQLYTSTPSLQNEEGKLSIVLQKLEYTTAALILTLETLAKQ